MQALTHKIQYNSRRDWDMMLVRLGKPVDELTNPSSGRDDDYRGRLSIWLANYSDRSCDMIDW